MRDTATIRITVGNTAPSPVIDRPAPTLQWRVGQTVSFSGRAPDLEDGAVAARSLTWALVMNHCSSATSCHEHFIQEYAGVASGSFIAPSHEYPSYLSLRLTARDSGGLERTVSVRLNPQAVSLRFETVPAGLQLALGSEGFTAPATRTAIVGSSNSMSAPSPQSLGGTTYEFVSWSNSGGQTQVVTAPATTTIYRATFRAITTTLPVPWVSRDIGTVGVAGSSSHSAGTFTVRGAGADIWGVADAFRYAYRPLDGNGSIVARVGMVSGGDRWTKVGVMIRASADAAAAHAFMLASPSEGFAFQRRTAAGAISTHTAGGTGTAPRWVRLLRSGNVITASLSSDGVTWNTVGQDTIALPTTALVGLAVSSHRTSSLATGTFDNVAVADAAPTGETVLLADDFNDSSLNTTNWRVASLFSGYQDPAIQVTETRERIQIGPLAVDGTGSHFNGIASAHAYRFAGGYAYVELVQPPTMTGVTYAMFAVGINSTNYYRWQVSGGRLYAQSSIGGTKVDLASLPYDSVAHRFWRIREVAGQVEFHTAPGTGGVPGPWTRRASAAWNAALPLNSLKFEMKAGTLDPHAHPGTAIFDTFKAAVPSETVLLADTFNDNVLNTDWRVANLFSGYEDPAIQVTETNERIQIGPLAVNATGSHFNGIASARVYRFAGGHAYVELVRPPAMTGVTYAMFAVGINSTNYYRWQVSGERLYAQSSIGGTKVNLASIPYDSVAHRFWRIREVAGQVEFHTAPGTGGVPGPWTRRASAAWNAALPLSSLKFEMKAGTLDPHANPGTAVFDTFKAAIPIAGN